MSIALTYYQYRGIAKFKLLDQDNALQDFNTVIELSELQIESLKSVFFNKSEAKNLKNMINNTAVNQLLNAYFFRGLIKIFKNETNDGCDDLSKAGEFGRKDAYEYIEKLCNPKF